MTNADAITQLHQCVCNIGVVSALIESPYARRVVVRKNIDLARRKLWLAIGELEREVELERRAGAR